MSNDNPSSESRFRTLEYEPDFRDRFRATADAHTFGQLFLPWYNDHHRHSRLGLLTSAVVDFGEAPVVLARRHAVLDPAYAAHLEQFVRQVPVPPAAVWTTQPRPAAAQTEAAYLSFGSLDTTHVTGAARHMRRWHCRDRERPEDRSPHRPTSGAA